MRGFMGFVRLAAIGLPILFAAPAAQSGPPTAEELAARIDALKKDYEKRIAALEAQLDAMKSRPPVTDGRTVPATRSAMRSGDNSFNPAIGVVFNGMLSDYSRDHSSLPGFPLGHESERPDEGLALGHSEILMSGNIDDKFRGVLTLGLGVHAGEPTELELEEAYIQTLPGSGLPDGVRLKAGRALWTFGYLNEHHAHSDDFSDRPLPYRAFLDGAYNDDGLELSVVLPGDTYKEIGGGVFRGGDTPFGGSGTGIEAWSAYARLGGDIGRDSAWRVGAYLLDGEAHGRTGGAHEHHAHGEEEDHAHGDAEHEGEEHGDHDEDAEHEDHAHADFFSEGMFTGDTRLYGVDVRYAWAPTGNARDRELVLQGEYFRRHEEGVYTLEEERCEDGDEHGHAICRAESDFKSLNGDASGWYVQGIYKFMPRWRAGIRYGRLSPPGAAELDRDPYTVSAMLDWTNSEFGRVRFQYNHESFGEESDDQIILQYIMNLGAHSAHSF